VGLLLRFADRRARFVVALVAALWLAPGSSSVLASLVAQFPMLDFEWMFWVDVLAWMLGYIGSSVV
jgi:hypothetical protein